MATNDGATPSPSSFRGRLNMESFRFQAGGSPQTQPSETNSTPARRSARLSSTISTSFKPTKANLESQPPVSSTKKRKAGVLKDVSSTGDSDNTSNSTATTTPPKKKRARPKTGYAPPSLYAHLPLLPDALAPSLLVLFCGLNPGLRTAETGHAYSHPSNRFWPLLRTSGILPSLPVVITAADDRTLPARFALGLTNIVHRPTRSGAELSKGEMDAGVAGLEAKVRAWRPEVVCVVGKGIWEAVWRVRQRQRQRHVGGGGAGGGGGGGSRLGGGSEFRYGWQGEAENMGVGMVDERERVEGVAYDDGEWHGARVFVATSTSGLAATPRLEEKERIWRELGVWVERRRAERQAAAEEEEGEAPVVREAS